MLRAHALLFAAIALLCAGCSTTAPDGAEATARCGPPPPRGSQSVQFVDAERAHEEHGIDAALALAREQAGQFELASTEPVSIHSGARIDHRKNAYLAVARGCDVLIFLGSQWKPPASAGLEARADRYLNYLLGLKTGG